MALRWLLIQFGLAFGLGKVCREFPAGGVYQFRLSVMTNVERRFPESVEAAVHYVVAEALTNAAKHARASRAIVTYATGEIH